MRNNEEGYIMVATMLILVLLTIIGVAATNTSNVEVQISSNTKKDSENFYVAESALVTAVENTGAWLTTTFLGTSVTSANYTGNIDYDNDGNFDALIEIRCIEQTGSTIGGLSDAANSIPTDQHTGPPPVNSGYSIRYFEIRKYAVTSTELRNGKDVQTGIWKVFNVFN